MQFAIDSLLSHFVTPFWSIAVGLALCALVGVFCIAAFWWEATGGEFFRNEGIQVSTNRVVNAALALAVPILITVGVFLIVFPVQSPVGVFLKSQSHPSGFDPAIQSPWDSDLLQWSQDLEAIGMTPLDASPYVDEVLWGLVDVAPQDGWRRDSAEINATISDLVLSSLRKDPAELRRGTSWNSRLPRWLIESTEIAVVKAMVLRSNVHALTIEAHPRRTPSGHAWVGIMRYFSEDLGAYNWIRGKDSERIFGDEKVVPASYIKDDASELGSEEVPYIVGRPRFFLGARSDGLTDINVVMKIAWPPGSTEAKVSVLVDGQESISKKLTHDVVVPSNTMHQISGNISISEVADLQVKMETAGTVARVRGVQFSSPEMIHVRVTGTDAGAVSESIRQVQNCNVPELFNWRGQMVEDIDVTKVSLVGSGSDVEVRNSGDEGVWLIPEGVAENRLEDLQDRLSRIPGDEFGDRQFMKASRSRSVSPGPYSFYNTPFRYNAEQLYFESDDGDAKAFIVDHDPRIALNSGPVRMHTARPLIVQWRLARDNAPGFVNLYHLAVNLEAQGLLLNAGCSPRDPEEFDNGRFFPFWRAFFEALHGAAIAQLSADAIEAGERLSEPLFALNDAAQARLRAERTRPGLIMVLLGVLLLLFTATRGVISARRVTRDK